MESNNYYIIKGIIPTIGIISSGKSTFLDALLGTDILEVGETTITEFILFIKHNKNKYLFQQIKLIEDGKSRGKFEKIGESISGEDDIKNKIKELNEEFKDKKDAGIDDLLYMLEIPIKTLDNPLLLENYCFMDLPGLNEENLIDKYINIFEKINRKLIKFGIFIFDSTSIGSDNAKTILEKLNEKKCLTKKNNLFILNKVDQCEKEKRDSIIEEFSSYFYNNFGEGALKRNKNNLYIDIYKKNTFIPLNSLLFKSENILNIEINFSCLLEKELFTYLEDKKEADSFYEYLKKKLNSLKENNNIYEMNNLLSNDDDDNDDDEKEIIDEGIENVSELIKKLNPLNFQKGIDFDNIERDGDINVFKNIFLLYKQNKWRFNLSCEFKEINEFFNNFEKEKDETSQNENHIGLYITRDSSSLSCLDIQNKEKTKLIFSKIIEPVDDNDLYNIDLNKKIVILNKLDTFISKNLNEFINKNNKIKDENQKDNNFKILTNQINCIKENIKVKKLRVSFIGNLSVGKSSILNCIIGDNILPIDQIQCTYRGIIIRFKDEEEFKLYKTTLHEENKEDFIPYYYFMDERNPICKGKKKINDFLNRKNKDIDVTNEDAFFVLTGRLKFFEIFKDDDKIICLKNVIEFIDLPGHNRNDNEFIKRQYYDKIMKYTNCCVYVNIPSSIDDKDSLNLFKNQFQNDKEKISKDLRSKIINSCVFVINKSDLLSKNTKIDKTKIFEKMIQSIKEVDNIPEGNKNTEINIPFFSAKYYFDYLKLYEKYESFINDSPIKLWEIWLKKWENTSGIKTFEEYIKNDLNIDKE